MDVSESMGNYALVFPDQNMRDEFRKKGIEKKIDDLSTLAQLKDQVSLIEENEGEIEK